MALPSHRAAEELLAIGDDATLTRWEELMGKTDCSFGCEVEPDGQCPHGYESAGLTAEVI